MWLQYIYMDNLIMIIDKNPWKNINSWKRIIQNSKACIPSSYKRWCIWVKTIQTYGTILCKYLLKERFVNNTISLCFFFFWKTKSKFIFAIVKYMLTI